MKRFLLALLPAILAHLIILIGSFIDMLKDSAILLWVAIGLVAIGAVLSGIFTARAIRERNPNVHIVVPILLFIVVMAVYFVTFFFTGCLSAAALGNL